MTMIIEVWSKFQNIHLTNFHSVVVIDFFLTITRLVICLKTLKLYPISSPISSQFIDYPNSSSSFPISLISFDQ